MITRNNTLLSVALAVLAPWSSAQSGGFEPGELVFFSGAFPASSFPFQRPLMRIDPFSGDAVVIADWPTIYSVFGGVAYDPFRDRLITMGHPTIPPPTPLRLWAVDSSGGTTDLGFPGRTFRAFAPGSGGRIYMLDVSQATAKLRYIDAANQEHVVLDASGTAPYSFALQSTTQFMVCDAGTQALFTAHQPSTAGSCGTNQTISVQKHPLSSDGSRVVGPVACNAFPLVAGPAGFSSGPNGLLLTMGAPQPMLLLVDPDTLAISPYAGPGGGVFRAGAYSQLRSQAVLVDTFGDTLRAYGPGDTGGGTPLPTSLPVSPPGGHSEEALLLEIPTAACGTNNVALYCTAKTSSSGCLPAISTSGGPSLDAGIGFQIRCTAVEANKVGILFYGKNGAQSLPFQGGFLCVAPPIERLSGQSSGGSSGCTGAFAVDFNAWIAGGFDPDLVSGTKVNGQFWFRDPTEPISGTGLSAALSFTICD
ncbi:MAG TPA: hypothetical protein VMT18_01875 [Planctomycetota bacterium]|nr:hypothetical protein [Planctomycetota bacterium]